MRRVIAQPIQPAGEGSTTAQLQDSQGHSGPPIETVQKRWIEAINEAFGFSTGWALKAGTLLTEAKAQLGHGQWGCLFGAGKLKFGQRTAEMLMEVARHPSFQKSKNFASLPKAWSALHALSKLPEDVVDQAIANGSVHSEMRLSDARRLVRSALKREGSSSQSRFDLIRQGKRVSQYLRLEVARWPAEHHQQLAELLQTAALDLLAQCNDDDGRDPVLQAMRYLVKVFHALASGEHRDFIESIRNLMSDLESESGPNP
jgi:hypothetical protein